MHLKRVVSVALLFVIVFCSFTISASASMGKASHPDTSINIQIVSRATGKINVCIPANSVVSAGESFPMAVGENVEIKASYAPFNASVDIGLIGSNGRFYYFNGANGNIDETIQIEQSGSYTLCIRNNSNVDVNVSGYVKY